MLVNGSPEDRIAAIDRGLLYGDGLFETLLVTEGKPCLWSQHLGRLEMGCKRLGMEPPNPQMLLTEARAVIGETVSGVLKLILTRGCGGRGYRPAGGAAQTRIVQLFPHPGYPAAWTHAGVVARYCSMRLGINPALAGIKHLNRLEQVMARAEWEEPGIAEGVMLDTADRVIEGTMSNLFLVRAGRLVTPGLHRCGIAGVMRALTLALARARGIPVQIGDLSKHDVRSADAAFFTNSLFGLWPIHVLDGKEYDPDRIPEVFRRRLPALGMYPTESTSVDSLLREYGQGLLPC